MSAGESLIGYLINDTTGVYAVTSDRICQNHVPETYARSSYIWVNRSSDTSLMAFDGPSGLRQADWDLECVATTADAAIDLADLVKTRLDGSRTSTGTTTIDHMHVADHSDDYLPKAIGDDDGLHVAALSVSMFYQG